jgi:putative thioredoxin
MAQHGRNADQASFQQVVIEGSKKVPVLVDFWAPWCAPCRALTPVLEKLAAEYAGRFTLVKINSDENQALAAQFGVRGIPNVKAFVNGELVDEFSGALSEAHVRAFINRVVPSPAEELRRAAMEAYRAGGKPGEALAQLARALELDSRNDSARMDRAEILLDLARIEEAREVLVSLAGLSQLGERAKTLTARLDLAAGAAGAGDRDSLKARIARDANDLDARLQLANLHVAGKDYRGALDQLLEIVKRDRAFRDDIARKTMLQIFSVLGGEDELVGEYRRRLAGAMY